MWLLLSLVLSLGGCGFSFFGHVNFDYYYSKSKSKVLDSTWIHPIVQENTFVLAVIPFWSYTRKGPPFSVGVRVVDYDNVKKYKKLELIKLEIINQGNTKTIVTEPNSLSSRFKTYVPRVDHVGAECLFKLKDGISIDYKKPIRIKAVFLLHNKDGFQKETIEAEFKPHSYKSFWRFWDVLSA